MKTEMGGVGEGVEGGRERERHRTKKEMGRGVEDSRTHLVFELRSPRSVFKMSQNRVWFSSSSEEEQDSRWTDLGSGPGSAAYLPCCPWQVT